MKFLTILLLATAAFSQPRATEISRMPLSADRFIGTDAFGGIYTISEDTFIKTIDGKQFEFKKLSLGKITSADIQNPLLIVLFYRDFNTAVLIDNQLNEVRTVDFSKLETPIVPRAIGLAAQNKIWVYESLTRQIGLYDYLKENYQPVSTPLVSEPKSTQSDFNHFQWTDAGNGHFACDLFGKISDLGKLPDFKWVSFDGDGNSIAVQNDAWTYTDARSGATSPFALPEKSIRNFYWNGRQLAVFNGKEIVFYKFSL